MSPSSQIHADYALAPLTSLRVGGPARHFAELESVDALAAALHWCSARGLELTLIGGGSNVVVADRGVEGLVARLGLAEESVQRDGEHVEVTVGAGKSWDAFVQSCVERGWSGLECLSGIPGQVGATPIQNVGAYGQEVADTLVSVEVFDRAAGRKEELGRQACAFGYRTSRFKADDGARFIVLSARFRLRAGPPDPPRYPEIARHFASDAPPTLAALRAQVLATRRQKSMLLDPADENGRSCGSFFLNPKLDAAAFELLRGKSSSTPPSFPEPDGRVKVPAAWLIEQAGFRRGQRWGCVGISSRHSLALVCHAGATAAALVEAAHRVRDGVARAFDVELSPEPRFLGFGSTGDGLPPLGSL